MNKQGQTICLNMIVKNEAPVIKRCLDSILPIIDTWVIVDTGSTDGTQDIIREHLKDLPGELVERPWVDFAHNRSEALEYARGKADYVIVIDADETLAFEKDFVLPYLSADSYNIEVLYGGTSYLRKQLVSNRLSWCYKGVLHEYIYCAEARSEGFLKGVRTLPHPDGARACDAQTYRRDALVLEKALLDEPENTRYVFYLAQSYRDAGDFELALRHYQRRILMGGWHEEVWYSLYQVAQIKGRMEKPWHEVHQDYLAAYQFKADRAGPLYRIGMHYQAKGEYNLSYLYFYRAMQIPIPTADRLFLEKNIYEFLLPLEYAVSCFYVGQHAEAIETNNQLLRSRHLPAHAIEQVIKNRRFSIDALFPRPQLKANTGKLNVCIPFFNPGSELDDLIASLCRQIFKDFAAVFIDTGSGKDHSHRIPTSDPRFSFIQHPSSMDWHQTIDHFIEQQCNPDDIIALLEPGDRLGQPETLEQLVSFFDDAECMLLYGQYRLPGGELGQAEPAPDESAFNDKSETLARGSLIAFRTGLWREVPAESSKGALFKTAGYYRTRFTDHVLTIKGTPHTDWIETVGTWRRRKDRRDNIDCRQLLPALAALDKLPMISCLMVTKERLSLAKRSIRCFSDQTYPRRELVIVTDDQLHYRQSLERFVEELGLENVNFVYPREESNPLGRLRNISMNAARGEIVCQWDDDDCNHPDRLMIQAEHMHRENARASFLTDHLQYLADSRMLAWVDWTLGGRSGKEQLFPGTLMLYNEDRFRYPETGPYARQGEDTALLYHIYDSVPVAPLVHKGYLYLYTFHGGNTFDRDHHYRLSTFSPPASELREKMDIIKAAMAFYPVAKPYVVIGRDGPAFVLNE